MNEYIDLVRKLITNMEETAWLLTKFNDMKDNATIDEIKDALSGVSQEEIDSLNKKYLRFERLIKDNL